MIILGLLLVRCDVVESYSLEGGDRKRTIRNLAADATLRSQPPPFFLSPDTMRMTATYRVPR